MQKLEKYDEISQIWLEYQAALENYILKLVKNKELSREISREVLMKVYNSCCSGSEISNLRSWLHQIAHNTCIDHFRKEAKKSNKIPEIQLLEEIPDAYNEASKLLLPLLKLIPEKYARPLYMADIQHKKQSEIAEELNLSLSGAKSRVQRGREHLRSKIMQCCIIEQDARGNFVDFKVKQDCTPLKTQVSEKK
ncbi:sigma-70 family RNA polymerase sigma factor [Salegentibacter sp. F14]